MVMTRRDDEDGWGVGKQRDVQDHSDLEAIYIGRNMWEMGRKGECKEGNAREQ